MSGEIAATPLPDFSGDAQAHAKLAADPAYKANQIVQGNPSMLQIPDAALLLANQPGVSGESATAASKYLALSNQVINSAHATAMSNPNVSKGHGWLDDTIDSVGSAFQKVYQEGSNISDTVGSAIDGAYNKSLDWAKNVASKEPSWMQNLLQNPLTVGLTPGGLQAFSGLPKAGGAILSGGKNYMEDMFKWIYFGDQNAAGKAGSYAAHAADLPLQFNRMLQSIAFYGSLEKRYGSQYASQYAEANIMAAILTGGKLGILDSGGELAAEGASGGLINSVSEKIIAGSDSLRLRYLQAIKNAGNSLTPEQEEEFIRLTARQADRAANEAARQAIKDAQKKRIQEMTPLRRSVSQSVRAVVSPLRLAMKAAEIAFKPGQDATANMAYNFTNASAYSSPELKKLWDDSASGIVTDAHGRRIGTSGQQIMEWFGARPNDMAFQIGANGFEFYAKYFGSDMLGAGGKIIGKARTAEGFTQGLMSKFFNGMGIYKGDDMYRAYEQYSRVRAAVNFMASHGVADILKTFRNFFDFSTEGVKTIVDKIAATNDPSEVLKHLADLAEGNGLVGHLAPSLTSYELMKFTIPKMGIFVGNALSADFEFIRQVGEAVKEGTGFDIVPKSIAEAATNDVGVRTRATFGRWFASQFSRKAVYFDEITKKWQDFTIIPGSRNAIAAIGDNLRALAMPEDVVNAAMEALWNAPPDDYQNVVASIYWHAGARKSLVGGVGVMADSVIAESMNFLKEVVESKVGFDGAGNRGIMLAGEFGKQLSETINKDTGYSKFSGIGDMHLGSLRFPNPKTIRGLGVTIKQALINLSRQDLGDAYRLAHISIEALNNAAQYSNATLEGIPDDIRGVILSDNNINVNDLIPAPKSEEIFMTAYKKEIERIAKSIPTSASTQAERIKQFVDFFHATRTDFIANKNVLSALTRFSEGKEAVSAIMKVKTLDAETMASLENDVRAEYNLPPDFDFNKYKTAAIRKLNAETSAQYEAISAMTRKLNTQSINMRSLLNQVKQYEKEFGLIKEIDNVQAEKLAAKLNAARRNNPRFLNGWQHFVEGLNKLLTNTFVPIALGSGGWAIRVSASEALLNSLRQGGWNSFESRVVTSIAKHQSITKSSYEEFYTSVGEKLDGKNASAATRLVINSVAHALVGVREIAAGVVLGVEKGLFNPSDLGSQRMIENFTGALLRHDGWLPVGVHSQTDDIFSDGFSHQMKIYGRDENGKITASSSYRGQGWEHVSAGVGRTGRGYVTAMFEHLTRISKDSVMRPNMREFQSILKDIGSGVLGEGSKTATEKELIEAGIGTIKTEQDAAKIITELEERAYQGIQKMPSDLRNRFERNNAELKPKFSTRGETNPLTGVEHPESEIAHRDWARAIAYNTVHSVMGIDREGVATIYSDLIDQATSGQIVAPDVLGRYIKKMKPGAEPKDIPARQFVDRDPFGEGVRFDFLNRASDKLHSKLLGPMVNALSRDPIWLLEYHNAYERIRPLVESNFMTIEQAEVKADIEATINMTKYVHNPKDKTLFEQNMRVAAPFYFAQNQAWRRAFRVLRDDPGAFEKYMKACLGITNYVATAAQNNTGVFALPGTQFMGAIGGFYNSIESPFSRMMFGLAADPVSISSVVPTGAESGLGMLGNIFRPSWGPIVTIAWKEAQHFLGMDHLPLAQKISQAVLGKVSANQSVLSELAPSTMLRGLVNDIQGFFGNDTSVMGSVMNQAMNEAMDNKFTGYYNTVYNSIKDSTTLTEAKKVSISRTVADLQLSKFMANAKNRQEMISAAHGAAIFMYTVKVALGFVSPVALSLQANFSSYPAFQKILNEKNPNGQPKYTFEQAANLFSQSNPTGILDLVAHTSSTFSPYPETASALDLLGNHPEVVKNYPNASAYLISRNSNFNPAAYQLELELNLRKKEAPDAYYSSLMVALGNDLYYNWFVPQYPSTGTSAQSYQNYKELQKIAKNYATHANPIWGEQFSGFQRHYNEAQAATQMSLMVDDPKVPDSVFGGVDSRAMYKALTKQYFQTVLEYNAATSSKQKAQIESDWYNQMTAIAPKLPAYSYYITGVLRGLPNRQI